MAVEIQLSVCTLFVLFSKWFFKILKLLYILVTVLLMFLFLITINQTSRKQHRFSFGFFLTITGINKQQNKPTLSFF